MFEGTGAFVIGRKTFDVGIDYWGEDGAFGKPCFVVTRRPEQPLQRGTDQRAPLGDTLLDGAEPTAGRIAAEKRLARRDEPLEASASA